MTELCRSCKAPIVWGQTVKGKAIPLDPEPTGNGNLRVDFDASPPRVEYVNESRKAPGELLYVTHFATCPFPDEHRKAEA